MKGAQILAKLMDPTNAMKEIGQTLNPRVE